MSSSCSTWTCEKARRAEPLAFRWQPRRAPPNAGIVPPAAPHQQVWPTLAIAQRHQQHLLHQGQLALPRHLFFLAVPLGGRLSERTVDQHPLPHREVLHQEHQAPIRQLVDLRHGKGSGGGYGQGAPAWQRASEAPLVSSRSHLHGAVLPHQYAPMGGLWFILVGVPVGRGEAAATWFFLSWAEKSPRISVEHLLLVVHRVAAPCRERNAEPSRPRPSRGCQGGDGSVPKPSPRPRERPAPT